ncbi:MmgE/PrpD family protein [Ottowia caeni]|uniref:MmgE/PrpD family protein n=1 Tax=Ottowia caeni TaxID=2870339 RepID=UPI001E4977CF|nr:MmgE/PrpD family protein [Ottowia caeni]
MSEAPLEERLVAHLVRLATSTPQRETRERLAHAILDWFTAGWSGQTMALAPSIESVTQLTWPGGGTAPTFGGKRLAPVAAGFCNAAVAHLREIDDAHRTAMLHPGVIAVSPVIALSSSHSLTRHQVMAGILAGYEVSLRIGEALGPQHAARFHATATAGTVGAAAAAGIALGLTPGQLHHALGIASTQAAGLWQLADDDAHESKSLHPGFAVRNGMMAAFLAQAGLPGAHAFLTGPRAMYALLNGGGQLEAITHELDGPAKLHTATIKAWPSCAMTFTALDALQSLVSSTGMNTVDIVSVHVEIFSHALKIANVDWPHKSSETPFSIRYLLAALLHHGQLGISEVETPALDDEALRALGARVKVVPSEALQQAFPERRPAVVTVEMADGRRLSARRELRRGDPEDPFTWDQLLERMRAFAPAMDDGTATALATWCHTLTDPSQDDQRCQPDAALFGPVI